MGVGFDGLIVEAKPGAQYDVAGRRVIAIDKIVNQNVVFGDRNIGFPLKWGSMFINRENLEEVDDSPREFSSKNPFGQVTTERKYKRGDLELTIVEFSSALSLTLREVKKAGDSTVSRTIYSQNFTAKELIELVDEAVDECLDEDRLDELPFVIRNVETDYVETDWRTDRNG